MAPPELVEGAQLIFRREGIQLFAGPLLSATTSSQSSVVDLSALDRGRYLVKNEGWYQFANAAPETAVAAICRDYNIPVASLARTGLTVSRKFPGIALDKIIKSLYALAAQKNGKRYLARFTGAGALEVLEKPSAATLDIKSTMGVTNTWDISNLQNSVAIRTDTGAWLEDHGLQQNLTVETLGDIRLISGNAVKLRDTGSGVTGLFWIESDTHTWKNGQYYCKAKLNFRNLADDTISGSELK